MKKLVVFFVTLFISISGFAQAVSPDAVVGTWLTGKGNGKVQIFKQGNTYSGKIVWIKEPNTPEGKPKVDRNNPDKTKQNTPLLGSVMMKDFIFEEDKWTGGTIYDAENGKTYSCKITYRDGKLDVRGYVGISLIGRTDTWFKVPDVK